MNRCMKGRAVSMTGMNFSMPPGMGMPGLPSGVTFRSSFFFRSCSP